MRLLPLLVAASLAMTGCFESTTFDCYSPTQNLDRAYDPDAMGCPCDDAPVCVEGVALICTDGYWQSVYDGPCGRTPTTVCYSPTQNLDIAYQPGATGCPCGPGDEDVCIGDTALVCQDGRWQSVIDGPCAPRPRPPPTCYSPSQNLDIAYDIGAIGCPCGAGDEDVCVDGVGLVCQAGRWQSVHDGPCMPLMPDQSCYSPTQNLDIVYDDGAVGCECEQDEPDVCVDGVGLICHGGRWEWVFDGPCGGG